MAYLFVSSLFNARLWASSLAGTPQLSCWYVYSWYSFMHFPYTGHNHFTFSRLDWHWHLNNDKSAGCQISCPRERHDPPVSLHRWQSESAQEHGRASARLTDVDFRCRESRYRWQTAAGFTNYRSSTPLR